MVNVKFQCDFSLKLRDILKIAFNFDPGTKFYDPGDYPSSSAELNQRMYTPEQIVNFLRIDERLRSSYKRKIDPNTGRFNDRFRQRIFSNKRMIEQFGVDRVEYMISEIEELIINH